MEDAKKNQLKKGKRLTKKVKLTNYHDWVGGGEKMHDQGTISI